MLNKDIKNVLEKNCLFHVNRGASFLTHYFPLWGAVVLSSQSMPLQLLFIRFLDQISLSFLLVIQESFAGFLILIVVVYSEILISKTG